MENWTHIELIALLSAVASAAAAATSVRNAFKIRAIHVEINARLSQMLAGARAEGVVQERADQDARDVVTSKLRN